MADPVAPLQWHIVGDQGRYIYRMDRPDHQTPTKYPLLTLQLLFAIWSSPNLLSSHRTLHGSFTLLVDPKWFTWWGGCKMSPPIDDDVARRPTVFNWLHTGPGWPLPFASISFSFVHHISSLTGDMVKYSWWFIGSPSGVRTPSPFKGVSESGSTAVTSAHSPIRSLALFGLSGKWRWECRM